MKSLYVKDLQKNQVISNETFAVSEVEKAEDKNGKPYYKVVLMDKTGKISGKIWSDKLANIDTKSLQAGKIISIAAKVEEYLGKQQLNILEVNRVDEQVLDEYLASSEYDTEEMFKELQNEIEEIEHKGIRKVLNDMFCDEEFVAKFKVWTAARSIHHDFKSGLLQHILEMITISKSLKRFYPNANYDILKAGIILHDIGKIEELSVDATGTNYTKRGGLVGHIVLGVMIFERYGGHELPEDCFLHIVHLILSHHGQLDMGSPVVPSTVEALMLTYLDNISSKSRAGLQEIAKIPEGKDFSNPYIFLQNARLWKGGNYDVEITKEKTTIKLKDKNSGEVIDETNMEGDSNADESLAFDQLGLD